MHGPFNCYHFCPNRSENRRDRNHGIDVSRIPKRPYRIKDREGVISAIGVTGPASEADRRRWGALVKAGLQLLDAISEEQYFCKRRPRVR